MTRRPAPRRIADRAIVTENINVDAVTTTELAPDSVTADIIATDAVTTDAIADGAVDTDQLAEGAVTLDIIDSGAQDELGGIDSTRSGTAPASPADGDFWIDTSDNNNLKRYNGTVWESVRDLTIAAAQSAATTAQSAATAAQSTADGKNKVFRQTSAPTATATGDVWFDTDDDNRIYRWDGSSWVANNLGSNAIDSLSANKITAGTIDASTITVSNLNASNISTGTLSADRIAAASLDANKLVAASITATQIAAGTITATQIAASTITASQIAAGTLSADNITAGTLSASVTLNAATGTIGGWVIDGDNLRDAGNSTILRPGGDIDIGGDLNASGEIASQGTTMSEIGVEYAAPNMSHVDRYPMSFGWSNDSGGLLGYMVNNDNSVYGYITHTLLSDRRVKEDIRNAGAEEAEKIYALNPVKFRYTDDAPTVVRGEESFGLIADEVAPLVPRAVLGSAITEGLVYSYSTQSGSFTQEEMELFGYSNKYYFAEQGVFIKTEYQEIDYTALVPYLVAAVKDLNTRLRALEES